MGGICPSCGGTGAVGETCEERVCAQAGYHYIPTEHAVRARADGLSRDAIIGRRVDDYLVVSSIGEGGFATVYLALQVPVMMKSAIKLMRKFSGEGTHGRILLEKFEAEARALAGLAHPNVVRLYRFGTWEGLPYMAMEFVENGLTLRQEIVRRAGAAGFFTVVEVRHIFNQVLNALAAAHARSLIHRDIKPENVMIQDVHGDRLHVKILDFGVAKIVSETADTTMVQGTPAYMAPEQFRGRDIGPWTDVYAVGAILAEVLTGHRVFSARTPQELLMEKLAETYDPARTLAQAGLPDDVITLLSVAVAQEIGDRFPTVAAFQDRLNAVFDRLEADGHETLSPRGIAGLLSPEEWAALAELETGLDPDRTYAISTTQVDAAAPHPLVTRSTTLPGEPARARRSRRGPALVVAGLALAALLVGGAWLGGLFHQGGGAGTTPASGESAGPEAVPGEDVIALAGPSTADQQFPTVGGLYHGVGFVAVWQDGAADGQDTGVVWRRFDRDGRPDGDAVVVNTYTEDAQDAPSVVVGPDDRFLVTWDSLFQDGSGWGVFAQLFDRQGRPLHEELQINQLSAHNQDNSVAAAFADGRFLVVWQTQSEDAIHTDIRARSITVDGQPAGDAFTLNETLAGDQKNPAVAALHGDHYLAVWAGRDQDGDGYGIVGRVCRLDAGCGPERILNTTTKGAQHWPKVAALPGGRHVVTWSSEDQDGDGFGVFARVFGPDGVPAGSEFQVNSRTEGNQWVASVTTLNRGGFVVLWMDQGGDGDGYGVSGQTFDPDGAPVGPEFRANVRTEGDQRVRSVTGLQDGRFVVAWEDQSPTGDLWRVQARIFDTAGYH
ncbi:MAG: serine/threonine-protein kinase [Pseudomonadota bacterium]